MGTIQDILFEEQGPPCLPVAVFISFEKYEGPTISNSEGVKVVPIVPIKRTWEGKNGRQCSLLQVLYVLRGPSQSIRARDLP